MFEIPTILNDPMWFGVQYEIINLIATAILLIHCLYYRGKWVTIKIFVVGMLYGIFLENAGAVIIPGISKGFFYEQNYQLYLFEFFGIGIRISQVPLTTHFAWSGIFYLSLCFWDKITEVFPKTRKNIILGGLIISASGLLIDLQLDVVATRFYWWVWNTDLKSLWFGVPLTNYIAWFTAVGVFGAFWVWHHEYYEAWDQKKQTWRLLWLMPVIIAIDGCVFFGIQGLFNLLGLIYV